MITTFVVANRVRRTACAATHTGSQCRVPPRSSRRTAATVTRPRIRVPSMVKNRPGSNSRWARRVGAVARHVAVLVQQVVGGIRTWSNMMRPLSTPGKPPLVVAVRRRHPRQVIAAAVSQGNHEACTPCPCGSSPVRP